MLRLRLLPVCLFVVIFLSSCSKAPVEKVKIGINPWPGYEFLYLAEKQGYFEEVGLPAQLVQLSSLSDVQRAYMSGRVDGMASTLIEVVQASMLSNRPLKVVAVPDYSNGGDVIVARKTFADLEALRGQKVGVEVGSLGIYVLHRALASAGMTLADVELVNMEQIEAVSAFVSESIVAYVTYPPTSLALLADENNHQVFSSRAIPNEIVDTISIDAEVLKRHPDFGDKLLEAWQMALEFSKKNEKEAFTIMAEREGISASEFSEALLDLEILSADEQASVLKNASEFQERASDVCQVLVDVQSLTSGCETLPDIVSLEP